MDVVGKLVYCETLDHYAILTSDKCGLASYSLCARSDTYTIIASTDQNDGLPNIDSALIDAYINYQKLKNMADSCS